jgi:hypothetical protein
VSLGDPTEHAFYTFDAAAQGWMVESSSLDPVESSWVRGATGAAGSANGWHVALAGNPLNKGYSDQDETTLTSPPVTFTGLTAAVKFFIARDMEPTFDFVHVEYSTDGANWTDAEAIDGTNSEYPDYEPSAREVRFANPGGPLRIRFRFISDLLISSPLHLGASVDQVGFISYPNAEGGGTAEQLPLVGPVPPPSAGGLTGTPPATRTGPASTADVAAGTGFCDIPGPAAPDLVVSDMTATQNTGVGGKNKQPREGDKVTISATITNGGDDAAPATKTEFVLDGTTLLGLVDTRALGAGDSVTVSVLLDTRGMQGEHTVRATADKLDAADESSETNNGGQLTFTVKGNKVSNPSFEQSNADGTQPASWSAASTEAGTASWSDGGSDGSKSVSITGTGGSALLGGPPTWTSDPIAVTAGETLDLVVSVRTNGLSSAPSAGLAFLGAAGQVLETVKAVTAPLTTAGFETLEQSVTIPAGVASVRLVLTGFAPTDAATAGTVTFDDVGLFAR